jgi:hypothetical protein
MNQRRLNILNIPNSLRLDLTNQDIVRRLGDTKGKGGGRIPIWINYEYLGLAFNFVSSDWNDSQNPISDITLFTSKSP